jgi:dihydrofolate reductase
MRKIVWMMSVSLDGYMEGPDHDISWHRVDAQLHRHFNEVLAPMAAFLDGRVTYELMAEFWPTADQDPSCAPTIAEFARIWREMPKVVYSRTLTRADWNTTVVREVDPAEIRRLKAQDGADLALGGADLATTFRQHDLIDEYRIYVHPVVLGTGTPMFHPDEQRFDLELTETRSFGNGVVLMAFQRSRDR